MKIAEAEAIVRERLGDEYMVVKLSSYWLVWRKDKLGTPSQSTSLDRAIEQAR